MMKSFGSLILLLTAVSMPARVVRAQERVDKPGSPAPAANAARKSMTSSANDLPTGEHTGLHSLFRDLGRDLVALPSVPTLVIAGIGGAAALAVHPVDDEVNGHLRVGDFLQAGELLGETGVQIAGALGAYVIGRWKHHPRAAHTGMDLLRAQVVAEALTQGLKVTVRRERPDGTKFAFPSGHAAVTVATATVIERHFGIAWSLPVYGMAAYVGASQLKDNRHWLSDVVFGSAVGAIAGRTITRHGRSNFAWVPVYTPGRGFAVLITRGTVDVDEGSTGGSFDVGLPLSASQYASR